SAHSGITIGIGYDLQFVSVDELRADWQSQIGADICTRLAVACRIVGSDALVDTLHDIDVPLAAAMAVFSANMLPDAIQETARVYPQVVNLSPARKTALVSLILNRGTSLVDSDPVKENRREMRTIRDLLAAGNLEPVADQFDSMARLWPTLPGLVTR